ncbi:MAG: hypothetical protein JKX73_09020 [Flavobacteriales bacterium]|nr:hypothetical protein [Flavobacteriales bacterium]
MKPTVLAILISLFSTIGFGQEENVSESTVNRDLFSFGVRSTQSAFGSSGYNGMGFGGQFRIRVGDRINTEWFADHIKTDLGGLGHRETAHIGWSVMFYPLNSEVEKGKLLPYLLAGHCFDFAKVKGYANEGILWPNPSFEAKRWTSAVQLGLGSSYHITDHFDATVSAQYMIHLGNDLDISEPEQYLPGEKAHLENNSDGEHLGMEGHILLTFSLNYILSFEKA